MTLAVLANGSEVCGPNVPIGPSPATARAALPVVGQGSGGGIDPRRLVGGSNVVAAMLGSGRSHWKAIKPITMASARAGTTVVARFRRCCALSRAANRFTAIE